MKVQGPGGSYFPKSKSFIKSTHGTGVKLANSTGSTGLTRHGGYTNVINLAAFRINCDAVDSVKVTLVNNLGNSHVFPEGPAKITLNVPTDGSWIKFCGSGEGYTDSKGYAHKLDFAASACNVNVYGAGETWWDIEGLPEDETVKCDFEHVQVISLGTMK